MTADPSFRHEALNEIHRCRQANNGSPKGGQFALIHPLWVGRIAENVGLRRSVGRNADACPCESG